jgi:hypothetical protein
MEKLTKTQGIKMFPHIWTIFLFKDDDFFAEPFSGRSLRHRCYFEKSKGINERLTVYFHLSEDERFDDLVPLPESIYFYGAFNEVTVYQIRSLGNIRKMTKRERTKFIKIITDRLNGKNVGDKLWIKPTDREIEKALSKLTSGEFYCFEPLEYAYHIYERG